MSDNRQNTSNDDENPQQTEGSDEPLSVKKTYKLYINGEFPRSESGRSMKVVGPEGDFVANVCRASRKDFRDAVEYAREALGGWSGRSSFNRGQIIYRMAEMLESRRPGMIQQLAEVAGHSEKEAKREVESAIDRLVWYAGWSDKIQQVFGSSNPVASPHFNFTVCEPTGVIACFTPRNAPLLGLVSAMIPIVVGGNTFVGLVDGPAPTVAMEFAEVLNSSDVPPGVVNLLTVDRGELIGYVGGHRDLDGIACYGPRTEEREQLASKGARSVTRVEFEEDPGDWNSDAHQSPYRILPFVEFKTTWHPRGS